MNPVKITIDRIAACSRLDEIEQEYEQRRREYEGNARHSRAHLLAYEAMRNLESERDMLETLLTNT